jgi:hypothetical protein
VSSLDGDEKQELEKSTRRSRERVAFFLFPSNPNVKLLLLSCRFGFRSINNFLSTLFLLFPLFVIARNFVVKPGGGIIVVLKIIMDCKPKAGEGGKDGLVLY